MQNVLLLCSFLIVGLVIGYVAHFLAGIILAYIFDCLKNCPFETWHLHLIVAAPFIVLCLLDALAFIRSRQANYQNLQTDFAISWVHRRIFPAGIAMSFVLFHPAVTRFISQAFKG